MRFLRYPLLTLSLSLFALLPSTPTTAQEREVKLKIVETTDIHGNFYPYDFIKGEEAAGSLSRVASFVRQKREMYGDNLILLDNGDILQGQPTAYYYNYIDTTSTHVAAEMLNYLQYDAGNLGNHDIETGRKVFERYVGQCEFPVLGANIIDTSTGEPAFKPYAVFEREGVKIVVLGMITPAIPVWLSENLWQGLRFDDMEETARHWMPIIREKENPDLIVGLFHSGTKAYKLGDYNENASEDVAVRVPGFDIVMAGHDHATANRWVENVDGDSVLVINPANNGVAVANVDVSVYFDGDKVTGKRIRNFVSKTQRYGVDSTFVEHFAPQRSVIEDFVQKKIGTFSETISTRDAYFGSSAFVDLIHTLQLEISGAEISFAAPLSFDASIKEGDVHVSDMFSLYKYENMLYTMALTGREIKGFLEMSYELWTHTMTSADDHLLLLRETRQSGDSDRASFVNAAYNFDSAAGIVYTVDVTQPAGSKVNIISMADGSAFDMDRTYRVAVNSYRGNGGGELLTKGAGIAAEELPSRILTSTDKDLRFYLMQHIEQKQQIEPKALGQWKFIPEDWAAQAGERDRKLLFKE